MKPRKLTIAIVLAAGLAAGCGADEESKPSIPATTGAALESRLSEIQGRFEFGDGACADISNDSQPAVQSLLDSLPASVDRDVRSALAESFDRLFQLTADQCDETKGQQTTPETDTTETTETAETTETTETTDTQTETETDTTETVPPPTEPTDTEPVPPTDEGDEGGGFGPGS